LHIDDPSVAPALSDMAAGRNKEHAMTFTAKSHDGGQLVMTALAVSPGHGDTFANHASGAALMLVGGQRVDISPALIEALQHGFGLTKAEARLAAFLINGSGVRGYAAERGVSVDAGKYLLKSIYAKTCLSSQTELVALLREAPLGWAKPLAAP
jgi:DNA-binding CsgD family transcriptional regulator